MLTIWKYELGLQDHQTLQLPEGAQLLHVGNQHGALCLWALVDPDAKVIDRRIYVVGTGHKLPTACKLARYIGTAMMLGGTLVWHVFDGDAA